VLLPVLLAGCYVSVGVDGTISGTTLDIQQQPESRIVRVGQSATFAVGVVGLGPLSFQWRRNGVDVSGARDFSYVTPPVTPADNGSLFTVRVCNDDVCVTSAAALLTVVP